MTIPAVDRETEASGGLFVKGDVVKEVYKLVHDASVVDALANHRPMSGATMRLRRQTASVDPEYVAEKGIKPKTAPKWDKITLTAETIASITVFTEEEVEDADIDTIAFCKTDTVERLAEVFDGFTLGYDPATPYAYSWSGNVPVANTIAYDPTVGDIAEHINLAMSAIEVNGYDCTGMVMHPEMKAVLRGMRDNNGNPIYAENLRDTVSGFAVFGVPTKFTRQMASSGSPATREILLAYTPYLKIGDRLELEVKFLTEATITDPDTDEKVSLAETDQVGARFRMRKAFGIVRDDVLSKITGV